jgi:nitrile hydratase accessory protein
VPGETLLDETGPAAPPRRNGELVFAAEWESRLFGMTMALHEAGFFAWDEFRARLIVAIADWERAHGERDPEWSYYGCWLTAFEALLADKNICAPATLDAREVMLAARPHGHDH